MTIAESLEYVRVNLAANAAEWLDELIESKANNGVKPLPQFDPVKVAAAKADAEAEVVRLDGILASGAGVNAKRAAAYAKTLEENKIARASFLLRISSNTLTQDDKDFIAAERAGYVKAMAERRRALIAKGLLLRKADADDEEKKIAQAAELAKLNAITGKDIEIADVMAVVEAETPGDVKQ
jgi:hypothetical protein